MRTFYALTSWDSRLARGVLAAIRTHLAVEGAYQTDIEQLEALKARGECHEEPKPARRQAGRPGRAEAHMEA